MSAQPDNIRGDQRFTAEELAADKIGGDTADFGDGKPTIRVFSGRYVHPLSPTTDEIDVEDIAHALSHQCRFSGHVDRFYSVAQHSVLVSRCVSAASGSRRTALWGLLHDATEAYLVDLPRPLKLAAGFGELYREAEADLMSVICSKFDLPLEEPAIVKHFDNVLVCTEARDLMGRTGDPWYDVALLPEPIMPWASVYAKQQFLEAFKSLTETN